MGGTTPILALPYPTGTDRVADGDNAIQALAEKVEAWPIPHVEADFTTATGLPTGFTLWQLAGRIADPTGTIVNLLTGGSTHCGYTVTKAGLYAVTMYFQSTVASTTAMIATGPTASPAPLAATGGGPQDGQVTIHIMRRLTASANVFPRIYFPTAGGGNAPGLFQITRLGG